jgi:hypothetical protein
MVQSVWPYDHTREDSYGSEKDLDELWCFVICPAAPPTYWDDLFAQINAACAQLGKAMGVQFRCRRAVDILSAGVIHPEIWQEIRTADLVIADITGRNGNVMFELGVASAWLDKDRVIIIREDNEETWLFDINPARQITYTRSPTGFANLISRLGMLIQEAIARAPFMRQPAASTAMPLALDLKTETDSKMLWGLSASHRRTLPGVGFEFGSLYNFRYGWISVGNLIAVNVRVKGDFRFNSPLSNSPGPPWIGVMLRSQNYFANGGHMALLRINGEAFMVQPVQGQPHKDVPIGRIDGFDPDQFVPFDISINESVWSIRIGSVEHTTRIVDLPHVFSGGRIIVEGQFCWICLRTLEVSDA